MQKSSYIEVLLMVVIVSAVGYGTVFIGAMTAPNVMDWNLTDSPDPYDQQIFDPYDHAIFLESQWYPTGQSGTEIMHDQAIFDPYEIPYDQAPLDPYEIPHDQTAPLDPYEIPHDQAIFLESQWYPTGQSGTEIMHDQAILNPLPSPPSLTGNDDQRIEIIEDDTRQEENAIKNDVGNYWLNKLLRRVDVRKEASDSQGIVWPIVNFLGRFFGF